MRRATLFLLIVLIPAADASITCFDDGSLIIGDAQEKGTVHASIPGTDRWSPVKGRWHENDYGTFTFISDEMIFIDPDPKVYSLKFGRNITDIECPGFRFSCRMMNISIESCYNYQGQVIAKFLANNFQVDERRIFRLNNPFELHYEITTDKGVTFFNGPSGRSKNFRDFNLTYWKFSNANLYTLRWRNPYNITRFSIQYRDCKREPFYTNSDCNDVKTCHFDDECSENEICRESHCQKLFCESCQYIKDHRCIDHECCSSTNCEDDEFCKNNICVKLICTKGYYVEKHKCVKNFTEIIANDVIIANDTTEVEPPAKKNMLIDFLKKLFKWDLFS